MQENTSEKLPNQDDDCSIKDLSIEELEENLKGISGIEKSAILLLSLDREGTSMILKELEARYVQQISLTMASFYNLKKSTSVNVFKLFLKKMQDFSSITVPSLSSLRESLVDALGSAKADSIIQQISKGRGSKGLDGLRWMSAKDVYGIIVNEHPQVQSIVLSYLDPSHAGAVFELFDSKYQLDIILRISSLDYVQTNAMDELNDLMSQRTFGIELTDTSRFEGMKIAASIMNNISSSLESKVMSWVKETDKDLSDSISDLMFVFENLSSVPDSSVQSVLREIDSAVLALALKGASDAVKDKVFNNISVRASETLKYDLDSMGPVKISEVEGSQREIVRVARELEAQGKITLAMDSSSEYLS